MMNVFRKDAHANLAFLFRQIRGEPLHQTNRWSLNLTWSPIPRLDLVGQ